MRSLNLYRKYNDNLLEPIQKLQGKNAGKGIVMFINLETPNSLHSFHQHITHQQAAAAASLAHNELVKPTARHAVPKVGKKGESGRTFWRKMKTDLDFPNSKDLQEFRDSGIDTVI